MNIFDTEIPKSGENFEPLYKKDSVLIERIVSSDKVQSSIYKQPYDEWLVLLAGEALLEVEERKVTLKKGDTLLIEAFKEHKVLKTKKGTIWLCVHVGVKDDI